MGNLTFLIYVVAYSAFVFLSVVLEALGVSQSLIVVPTIAVVAFAVFSFAVLNATMNERHYLFGQKPLDEVKAGVWFSSHAVALTLLLSSMNFLPVLALPVAAILGVVAFSFLIRPKFRDIISLHKLASTSKFNALRLCVHSLMALVNLGFAGVLAFTIANFASTLMPSFTPDKALLLVISSAVFMVFWGGMKTQTYAQGTLLVLLTIGLLAPFGLMQFSPDWTLPSIQPRLDEFADSNLLNVSLGMIAIAGFITILPGNLLALDAVQKKHKPLKLAAWSTLFTILMFCVAAFTLPSLFPVANQIALPELPGTMKLMAVMVLFIIAISVLASSLLSTANLLGLYITNSTPSLTMASRKMLTLRLCLIATGFLTWLSAHAYTDVLATALS